MITKSVWVIKIVNKNGNISCSATKISMFPHKLTLYFIKTRM